MINKDRTLTVAELLAILTDGRINVNMPIGVYTAGSTSVCGVDAFEVHTFKDGATMLTFFKGSHCATTDDVETSAEVFP